MGEPIPGKGPEELQESDPSVEVPKQAEQQEQPERAPYVSSGDLIHEVHMYGGRTRDILTQEEILKTSSLQREYNRLGDEMDVESWNQLMAYKADENQKLQAWLDAKKLEHVREGRVPYIQTTELHDKVHGFGGHASEIIDRGDVYIINDLQPKAGRLNVEQWNQLMGAKERGAKAMEEWLTKQG